ncbi:DUF2273 domain-containing protein [Anaerosolibacter sp.]|uniref:DUF2273 domain-containing protein n=1 Tax=Anaerosolibacter sp. TaxID=1872527 RepID=UPI0039F0D609
MRNMSIDKEKLMEVLNHHRGKIIGMLTGLFFSVFVIWIGIIKTLFITLCIYLGFFIGKKIDDKEDLLILLDKILPPGKF